MSETTDVNGDPIEQNKKYRLDFATGEMIPVETEGDE
jgi:hypothetical protein